VRFVRIRNHCHFYFGAQDNKVHEHLGLNLSPGGRTVITFEIEAYPEPKVLSPSELCGLVARYGGFKQTARAIGDVSEGFVRQNLDLKGKK